MPSKKPTQTSARKRSPNPVASVGKPVARKVARKSETSPTERASALVPVIALTHDQIAQRAYEIWIAKGFPQGQASQNWSEAQQQLQREAAGA